MAAFVFMHNERRRIRRERIFRDRKNPVDFFTDAQIVEHFRLPRQELFSICDSIKSDIDPAFKRKGWIPPIMQLMIAIKFYATGTFHSTLSGLFGVSGRTNHRIVHKVTKALLNKAKFPLPKRGLEARQIKENFFNKAGFPNVFGCVDGTHIKILGLSTNEHEYVNRKMTHSINVQVVCDSNMRVINLVSKWPGSVHDARILRKSALFLAFENPIQRPLDGVFLGDSGYPLRDWLMTPIANPRNAAEEAYNIAHKITRCTIERVIGVVKRRWHCLHTELRMTPDRACQIIYVCFWLHNVAVDAGIPIDEERVTNDTDDDNDNANINIMREIVTVTERHHHAAGKAAQLEIIHRFFRINQ